MTSYEMNNMYGNSNNDSNDTKNSNETELREQSSDDRTFARAQSEDIENQLLPSPSLNWQFKTHAQKFKKKGIVITFTIVSLVLLALFLIPISRLVRTPGKVNNNFSKRSFTIDQVLKGEFLYEEKDFHFIRPPSLLLSHDADPGLYLTVDNTGDGEFLVAKQLFSDSFSINLGKTSINYNDIEYIIKKVKVNYALDKMIIGINIKHEYRHSSKGLYFLKDLKTDTINPISPLSTGEPADISYVHFSPCYNFIYYVFENNLYVQNLHSGRPAMQITQDGSSDIFNGRPDWIYEEEIFSNEKAVWWAPDDSKLVFAKINDTEVLDYYIPKYTNEDNSASICKLKYPRPGTKNPKISLLMLDLQVGTVYALNLIDERNENDKPFKDLIIYDANWIDPNTFLFKIADRTSKKMLVKVYEKHPDFESLDTVRMLDATQYGGWIEKTRRILPIPPNVELGRRTYGYVDIETDASGFNHLFYYDTSKATEGKQITSGDWEVTGRGIVGYEYESDTIFFTANAIGQMSQHLYGVAFNLNGDSEIRTFQNPESKEDFYDYELSSSGNFALMRKLGPGVPFTAAGLLIDVFDANNIHDMHTITLIDNTTIEESLVKYDLPHKRYSSMVIEDNVRINYVEIRPAHLDVDRKYPVLVSVYGGPGSQTYTTKHSVFFEEAVSSGLNAIVLEIEPRGTGGKGWAFKKWATERIGYWEPRDITEVTKRYIAQNRNMIDEDHIAVWGWSYGGFSTLKTVEYDSGQVFKYAMAVAPVTNWSYYDSFYSERYIGDPIVNYKTYRDTAAVINVENFKKLERFLIIHGTADDNVHIRNTYEFIDKLNTLNIENYDMHIFPDSDHSIQFHNSQQIVFRKLYYWLQGAFNGHYKHLETAVK